MDQDGSVDVRLHRMIRRGTSYGPPLPPGVLEDDGADRGIIFVFAGAHIRRQFEFVKKHFELVIVAIVFISLLPAVFEWWRARRAARHAVEELPG